MDSPPTAALPDHNPLMGPVLRLLRSHPLGLSEHQIIRSLEAAPGFPVTTQEPQLALFQKHFLVMNALYRLRDSLWCEEKLVLEISPLRIVLRLAGTSEDNGLQNSDHALTSYYLDWQQLQQTRADDVAELLAGFWQRFSGVERRDWALAVLDLPGHADWPVIQHRYRQLAARHHPDRGGDTAIFLEVREAFETLRAVRR